MWFVRGSKKRMLLVSVRQCRPKFLGPPCNKSKLHRKVPAPRTPTHPPPSSLKQSCARGCAASGTLRSRLLTALPADTAAADRPGRCCSETHTARHLSDAYNNSSSSVQIQEQQQPVSWLTAAVLALSDGGCTAPLHAWIQPDITTTKQPAQTTLHCTVPMLCYAAAAEVPHTAMLSNWWLLLPLHIHTYLHRAHVP